MIAGMGRDENQAAFGTVQSVIAKTELSARTPRRDRPARPAPPGGRSGTGPPRDGHSAMGRG